MIDRPMQNTLRRRNVAWLALIAVLTVVGIRPTLQAQRPAAKKADQPPPPDGRANSDVEAPRINTNARFRRSVSQTLHFQERQHGRLLSRAIDELKRGRTVNGLRFLQRIIDLPEDRFTWHGTRVAPVGLRQRAADLLGRLKPFEQATYERMVGFAAKQLIDDATNTGQIAQLHLVVRRYLHTQAGFDAGHRLALIAFERGDFQRAISLWKRLWQIPMHRKRFTAMTRLQFAIACRKTGHEQQAANLLRGLGTERLRIGGRPSTAGRFFDRTVKSKLKTDWRFPLGNAARNRTASTSTPFPKPLWSQKFVPRSQPGVPHHAARWRQRQIASGRSTAVVNSPLVVGNAVILRDFDSVRSVDLRSGKWNWSYKSTSGIAAKKGAVQREAEKPDFVRDFAGNSLLHSLTSDGRRVYFVDQLTPSYISGDARSRFAGVFRRRLRRSGIELEPVKPWNRLVAVALSTRSVSSTRKPVWTIGGPEEDKTSSQLAGHFFLGPPLPTMGRLYVISENKQELRLLCLSPETGKLIWSQPLAVVDRPVSRDRFRFGLSCTPAFADGLLICPTRTGFVVAVDAVSGTLKWAAFCGDDAKELQIAELAFVTRVAKGHAGFRSLPVIHNGCVLYLPSQSNSLVCIDLHSGRMLWKKPRNNAEYIAAVDDGTVLVAGRRYARGLSLADGKLRWSTYTGMPSGRGLATGRFYLLPVESGKILTMDRRSGRLFGFGLPGLVENSAGGDSHSDWRPGNLVAAGSAVLSAEFDRIRVFPTARAKLDLALRDLKSRRSTVADLQNVGRLAALVGDFDKADRYLTVALRRLENVGGRKDSERRTALTKLLRELLFTVLEQGSGDPSRTLARLNRLSVEPQIRGRFLIRKAEFDLHRRDGRNLLRTIDEFCRLETDGLIALPGRESHLVSAAAWVPSMLARARRAGNASLISHINGDVLDRRRRVLASRGIAELEQYLKIYGTFPQAGVVRNELARRLSLQGDDQRAELLLLTNRLLNDASTAAVATQLLFRLWMSHGLYGRAASLLGDFQGRFAKTVLPDGKTTGGQFAATTMKNEMTNDAFHRRRGPRSGIRSVAVEEQRGNRADLSSVDVYSRFRQLFPTPSDSPYDLLDLGDGIETELVVVHRATGAKAGKIAIPARHSYPVLTRYAHVGQFLSLGSAGKMHGISLLELQPGKPFWTTKPQGFANREDVLLVGPAGATFALFQARSTMIAVDPGTGRLLWQRNDLPQSAGLRSNPYSGLFGDERVLTVFDADGFQYTTYLTATGEMLKRGRLAISTRHERRLFGRLLFYVHQSAGKTWLRIWDPLTDRHVMNREIDGSPYITTSTESELVVLTPNGKLLVIDVPAVKVRQTIRFEPRETRGMTYLKAFRAGGRLFVNIQRPVRVVDRFFSFYAGDAFGRTEHIRGELYAFDVPTGRRLWLRTFPQRTVLQPRSGKLPVLVMLSRIRDRRRGTRAALRVEALDVETGHSLGSRSNLLPDRILHVSFDPRANTIDLSGIRNRIRLKLRYRRILGAHDEIGL